jgi:hypothetical protein
MDGRGLIRQFPACRPRYNNMRWKYFIWILLIPAAACHKHSASSATERPFYLGVTPWPADFTLEELANAYTFINTHCDIVSHHFDEGIPYEEAYTGSPLSHVLQNNIAFRRQNTASGRAILLSVAPLDITRHHKAGYTTDVDTPETAHAQYWGQLAPNDPKVITAYVNFVSILIDSLHPSFVNYGVESNATTWDDAGFALYRDFLSKVYPQLKAKYPSLPFFLSFIVDESPPAMEMARQLLNFTDYISLSAYPYTGASSTADGNTDPSRLPKDYFTRWLDLAPDKPWAFAETGYIATDLTIPAYQLNKHGKDSWQQDYLDLVCGLCNQRKAKFLIWFCSRDYDATVRRLQSMGAYQDLFGLWEHTGLIDSAGRQRPAYTSWLDWMHRPHHPD